MRHKRATSLATGFMGFGVVLLLATIISSLELDFFSNAGIALIAIGIFLSGVTLRLQQNLAEYPSGLSQDPGIERRIVRPRLNVLRDFRSEIDPLTKLPDQTVLAKMVHQAIRDIHRGNTRLALIAFDIDRLKDVNGCFGYDIGDMLLSQTAHRLNSLGADIAVRLSGDRFAVLMTNITDSDEAEMIGVTCLERISKPIENERLLTELTPSARCRYRRLSRPWGHIRGIVPACRDGGRFGQTRWRAALLPVRTQDDRYAKAPAGH